jgi:UDP-N-acetylmuramyl pentapeptide synthase
VVGLHAAKVFDAVCVIEGERARILAEAAGAEIVANNDEAVLWVRRNAVEGDRVLVKGSHGIRLDQVVKELTR